MCMYLMLAKCISLHVFNVSEMYLCACNLMLAKCIYVHVFNVNEMYLCACI